MNPNHGLVLMKSVSLYTLRHNRTKLSLFRALLGGQKYHASPLKALFNRRRCNGENKKRFVWLEETGRGKGCLVLVEAAISSSGGQDRLKEAKETKRKRAGS